MTPRKILVVDDSKLMHRMFDMLLRQFVLVHAFDGQEGLTALAQHPDIDLILLDINMPVMDGLEFLKQARAASAFDHIPVIVVSTEGKEADTERAVAAGASGYITKPFGSGELMAEIERIEPGPAS